MFVHSNIIKNDQHYCISNPQVGHKYIVSLQWDTFIIYDKKVYLSQHFG